jgi:hypothetical protein
LEIGIVDILQVSCQKSGKIAILTPEMGKVDKKKKAIRKKKLDSTDYQKMSINAALFLIKTVNLTF